VRLTQSLGRGELGILQGARNGFPHFILVNGYSSTSQSQVANLEVVDPWDGLAAQIAADDPQLKGFSFGESMRIIKVLKD
jgi:hypothetical protein